MNKKIAAHIAERNRAFTNMDLDWARRKIPDMVNAHDEFVAVTMHKARYECPDIDPALRHASRVWLQARGYARMYNIAFLPEGKLP